MIFSRFGSILCCEVIRDRRTGASLQYAFIEFSKPEHCEQAFLKMDNVLIDDRRIHVDFSQSVAKNYQWKRPKQGLLFSTIKTKNSDIDISEKVASTISTPNRIERKRQRSSSPSATRPSKHEEGGKIDRHRQQEHGRERDRDYREKRHISEMKPRKQSSPRNHERNRYNDNKRETRHRHHHRH